MKYPRLCSILMSVLLLGAALTPGAFGQTSKAATGKAQSCDGAADIVPVKPMSFVRKRRPAPPILKDQTAGTNKKS